MKKVGMFFVLSLSILFCHFSFARTINVVISKLDPAIAGFKFRPLAHAEYINPRVDFTESIRMSTESPNFINTYINVDFAYDRMDSKGSCEFKVWSGSTYFNDLGVTPICYGELFAFVSPYTKVGYDTWEINVSLRGNKKV